MTPPARTTSPGSSTDDDSGQPDARAGAPSSSRNAVAGAGVRERRRDRACGGARPDAVLAGQSDHGLGADELLEAAGVADADLADQRRAGHGQEADLAGTAGGAAVQPAVDDDRPRRRPPRTTAGRSRRCPGAAPSVQLGHGGEVDVVVDVDRDAERVAELGEEVGVVPAGQVTGVAQSLGAGVEGARRADHEPVQLVAVEPGRGAGPSSACSDPRRPSPPRRAGRGQLVACRRSARSRRRRRRGSGAGVTSSPPTYAASGSTS